MPSPFRFSAPVPMLTYVVGDIFRSPAAVLVNTVNTKGVMGKGLAKDFKAIYPDMFRRYQNLCESGKLDVGNLYLYRGAHKWVLNFPTKRDWKHPSKVEYVEKGLKAFVAGYARNNINSIAFPQLGCGHGDLDWDEEVQPLMEKYLSNLPIPVYIHLYRADVFPKEHKDLSGMRDWLHSQPESLGFDEIWQDVCTIVTEKAELTTLEGNGRVRVTLRETDGEERLVFESDRCFSIAKDDLLDVWQHFRAVGFLVPENLPEGLDAFGPELMALIVKLPYVNVVDVARGRLNSERQFTKALQLVPRSAPQGPLFELHASLAANA